MSGLILPDVPYEGKEEFDVVLKKYGLDLISMIAPTSHQRIQTIAKDAGGFIYILRFWFRNRGMRYVKNCRIVTIC